jgi:hypothetical protein
MWVVLELTWLQELFCEKIEAEKGMLVELEQRLQK